MAGIQAQRALGRDVELLLAEETAFDTLVTPVVGHSVKVMNYSVDVNDDRRVRQIARGNRARHKRHPGLLLPDFSFSTELAPLAAGTPPDVGPALKAFFGDETIVSSTSVTYGLAGDESAPTSLQALFVHRGVLQHYFGGSVVNQLSMQFPQNEDPSVEFSCLSKRLRRTGYTLLDGAASSDTTIDVDDTGYFEVGSVVQVGSTITRVTAINSATSMTLADAVSASDNAPVTPVTVWSDDPDDSGAGGEPIAHTDYTLDISTDSLSDLDFVSASFEGTNNIQRINPAGKRETTDFILGHAELTGTLGFFGERDRIDYLVRSGRLNNSQQFDDLSFTVTAGTAGAPGIVTVTVSEAEFDVGNISVPDAGGDDFVTFEIPFYAVLTNPGGANRLWSVRYT